jgi:hypothetical protein
MLAGSWLQYGKTNNFRIEGRLAVSETTVWARLHELTSREIEELVEASVYVLADIEGASYTELTMLPLDQVTAQLTEELKQADMDSVSDRASQVTHLERDQRREYSLILLQQLRETELAAEIEDAYNARREMMAIDAGLISGPALLAILLLRIRRVKIGKEGLDVSFDQVKPGLLSSLHSLLGLGGHAGDQ